MGRRSDCLSLPAPRSPPFGARNTAVKRSGAGNYRAGWYLLDDDTVELDGSMGREPLTYEIDRTSLENKIGISNAGACSAPT
jgi:hypothetical protein